MLAPIVLFVFNRPDHTRRTIEALKKNDLASSSDLYIYSDAPRSKKDTTLVSKTREYIKTISGFKSVKIIERQAHHGLAGSLIPGISEVISEKGMAIVMEDDLISAPNMLRFMNDCLDFYKTDPRIFAISAYNFPVKIPAIYKEDVYLSYRALSWGWATWKERWEKADWEIKDFDDFINDKEQQEAFNRGGSDLTRMLKRQMAGEIDSWAIRWSYNQFRQGAYSVVPVKSKIVNIGADNSGTNVARTKKYHVLLDDLSRDYQLSDQLSIDPVITENFKNVFKRKPFFVRLCQAIYHQF